MTGESLQPELGAKLRTLRRERGLKLADVSEGTGISASFLSLVESGKNDVTISRLARLCQFYGISVADVLPPPAAVAEGLLRRGEQQQHFISPAEGIDISVLGNGASMVLYRIEYAPGAHTSEQITSANEGILMVAEGRIEVAVDDLDPVLLESGDTLHLPAGRRHGYANPDPKRPAALLAVIARRSPPGQAA